MSKEKLEYYDPQPLRTRNAVFNAVCGARGLGKTYGFKKQAINDFLKKRKQFIMLRRYDTELDTRRSAFNDIVHEFPNYDFEVVGYTGFISHVKHRDDKKRVWQELCFFVSLSTAQSKKSTPYPNVHTIIFDEFIIENEARTGYLKNEVTAFINFYSTVDRYQDRVKVYFLANSVAITNPYFIAWGIRPKEGQEFITKQDGFICFQFPDGKAFSASIYKTRFGQFIKGTEYADYAVENVFGDNHDMLLALKDSRATYQFTLETKGGVLVVWYSHRNGYYYAQEKRPKQEKIYTTMPNKMSDEKLLLLANEPLMQIVKTAIRKGRMFFDTPKTRNTALGIL